MWVDWSMMLQRTDVRPGHGTTYACLLASRSVCLLVEV